MSKDNYRRYQNSVLVAMCIAIFVPNFVHYQLSPLAEELMSDLHLSQKQFSFLFSAPMIPSVFLSLVAGILVDRYNSKRVMGLVILVSTIGSIINLFAGSYPAMLIAFILMGITAGFLNTCNSKLLGGWFQPKQVSSRLGIVLACSTGAMTIAMATTAYFSGRKAAFTFSTILFVIVLAVWWIAYKEPEKKAEQAGGESVGASLKVVTGNRNVWLIGLCLFFIMGGHLVASSYLPTVLAERGIEQVAAGYYSSAYTLGHLLSCFLAPFIASKAGGCKKLFPVFAVLGALGVALSWRAPAGILLGLLQLLTGFCVGAGIPLLMSLPIQLEGIGPRYAGTAGGLTATIQILGAIVLPTFVLVPISGGNLAVMFILGGVCMAAYGALSLRLKVD